MVGVKANNTTRTVRNIAGALGVGALIVLSAASVHTAMTAGPSQSVQASGGGGARRGDRAAAAAVYRALSGVVHTLALRLLGDAQLAKEVTQDTFVDVIERAVELWSNPGDLVFSPFTGIGSEGVVSVEMGRRFVGAELKSTYFDIARRNLAEARVKQSGGLFADEEAECATI